MTAEFNAARKRLFTKKNERSNVGGSSGGISNNTTNSIQLKFDPNLSLGSNGSTKSTSSSSSSSSTCSSSQKQLQQVPRSRAATTTPSSPSSQVFKSKATASSSSKTRTRVIAGAVAGARGANPLMVAQQRSKSNNDLYYELVVERTNSAQDLLELINNCAPPVGDLSKYKLMLSECEKFTPTKKSKQPTTTQRTTLAKQPPTHAASTMTVNNNNSKKTIITNKKSTNNNNSLSYSSSSPRSDSFSMTSGDSLEMINTTITTTTTNTSNTANTAKTMIILDGQDLTSSQDSLSSLSMKQQHRRSLSLPSYQAVTMAVEAFMNQNNNNSINNENNEYKSEFKNMQ